MYVPRHFATDDPDALFDLIEAHPFALMVINTETGMEAAHLPFLLDRKAGPHGTLRCHVAHANPIWKACDGTASALIVFGGQNAYISPDWYASEHQVPTWNYAAVHATGKPRVTDDIAVMQMLDDLSAQFEEKLLPKRPWTTGKMPEKLYTGMRKAIVGLEIGIESLTGKWKLSQNKKPEDVEGAAGALEALGGEANLAIAAMMRAAKRS
ncbi:FMN-binding negative transcriptional regulator [Oceanibaculum nanhaiense]|uniref:FMN-binding negative transcriptional regulator n=1 Tax=Oceanibaculum nanhaiense TaxID=1909734 RepID=UPI00396D8E54